MQEQILLAYIKRINYIGTYALIHQVYTATEYILILYI
jgi:hypothetical protein